MVRGVLSLEVLLTMATLGAVLALFVAQFSQLEAIGVKELTGARAKYACLLLSSAVRNSAGITIRVELPYRVRVSCPLTVNGVMCEEQCAGGGEGSCFVVSNGVITKCSS